MISTHLRFYLLFCLILASFSSMYAQQDSIKGTENLYKKNIIHGSIGTVLIGYTANIFYDRILSESQTGFSTFARIGYQGNITLFSQGSAYILEGGMLTGKKYGHFEGALGVTYLQGDRDAILPAFSVGYRGQKPTGIFMFRTGVGFPELLYFGIGLAL